MKRSPISLFVARSIRPCSTPHNSGNSERMVLPPRAVSRSEVCPMAGFAEMPEKPSCHPERSEGMNSRLKCNSMFQEYLVGSFEAEAFSGSVVIAFEVEGEAMCWQGIEVGVSGQLAAQTTNRVFDAALL